MKRRQFIGLSAYLAAAISFPLFESCAGNVSDSVIAEPSLLMRILDKKNIIAVGKKYLDTVPDENDKTKLIHSLVGKNSIADSSVVRSQLDKQCNEDFNSDNTRIVNGWVLSRTEARQCALFSILQS